MLSISKLTSIPQQVIEPTKKAKKKEKNKSKRNTRNEMKSKCVLNGNIYHETTPFIVFICNKKRVDEIFLKPKLQIMWLKILTSLLGFKNYFLTFSALETLTPPNLCLPLHLSQILNVPNVSFSSGLK